MIKKIFMAAICLLAMVGSSWAQSWEIELGAGTKSAGGGIHYRQFVDTGFFKFGATGVYSMEQNESYRVGSIDFLVGSDTLSPGLTLEVGLKGLFGLVENNRETGDLGGVGFTGYAEYLFSRDLIPIPVETFGAVTYAPESLLFWDSKNYIDFSIGAGVRIGRYASVRLSYTTYHFEMETNADNWTSNEGSLRLGLVMRF